MSHFNNEKTILSHIGNESTPCETPIPPFHQSEDAIHGIKRNLTLRLKDDAVVTAPTQPKPNLGKIETQNAVFPEEKTADVTVLSSDDAILEPGSGLFKIFIIQLYLISRTEPDNLEVNLKVNGHGSWIN